MPQQQCPVPRCSSCLLWGHAELQCPDTHCPVCDCYGHTAAACQACKHCQQYGHEEADCPQKQLQTQAGASAGWLAGPSLPEATTKQASPARPAPLPRKAAAWQHKRLKELQQLDTWGRESPGASESSSVWSEPPEPEAPAVWEEQGGDWEATGRTPMVSPAAPAAAVEASVLLQPLPDALTSPPAAATATLPQPMAPLQQQQSSFALRDPFSTSWAQQAPPQQQQVPVTVMRQGQEEGYLEAPPGFGHAAGAEAAEPPPGFEGRAAAGQKHKHVHHAAALLAAAQPAQQQAPSAEKAAAVSHAKPDYGASAAAVSSAGAGQEAPAALLGSSTAVLQRAQSVRRYVPAGQPVCRVCGARGHVDADCTTPYCQECDVVSGHCLGQPC